MNNTNPSGGSSLQEIQRLYQTQTTRQLHRLQKDFVHQYRKSGELAELYLRKRICELEMILLPLSSKEQIKALAEGWGIRPRELKKLSYILQQIIEGKNIDDLKNRTLAELHSEDEQNWISPMAIIDFYRWLKKGDFTQIQEERKTNLISWIRQPKEERILLLHHELLKMEAIPEESDPGDFLMLFQPGPSPMILWRKSERLLYYLFAQLAAHGLILPYSQSQLTEKISDNFLRRGKKPIKAKSLAANVSNEYHPPRGYQ
ncbi:MAG: hypothetical protein AAFY70_10850, partial [Bacteroidota bacterium]